MSFVGKMLGMGGSGMNYQAQKASLLQPVSLDQTANAYNQSQSGISQQQAFVNALLAQNGLGNQSNVFNQQQNLATMLGQQARGEGPNPALAQLNQTTGQNIAQQSALMAGQRGAGANAGLLARQAAMQGANIQQQAVGQAAVMRANQQLAAEQALQQQQAMMGNVAGQQVGQLGSGITTFNQAAQAQQNSLLGAAANYNNANVAAQNNVNSTNAQIAQQTAPSQAALFAGALGGAGTLGAALPALFGGSSGGQGSQITDTSKESDLSGMFKAKGGMITNQMPHYAAGGDVGAPASFVGRFINGWESPSDTATPAPIPMASAPSGGGGGGKSNPLGTAMNVAKTVLPFFLEVGGAVPGQAQVSGDSLKNDTVPAMLSPGEIVIPRHVIQSADPVKNSAKFVEAILARHHLNRGGVVKKGSKRK